MARARLHVILDQRITKSLRRRLEALATKITDPNDPLQAKVELLLPLYSYDLIPFQPEPIECDARAHEETWADMLRLYQQGVYPAAFAAIRTPVRMLHGAVDPHPGRLIWQSLCEPLFRKLNTASGSDAAITRG